MSARLWSGLVILKDHENDTGADANGNFDLSNKYVVIEYQDTFPRSAIITLNSKGGRFITLTPKIQKWDRIYLEITDQDGGKVKQVFQVESMDKMRPPGKGLQLKLYCSHQSSNLLSQTISIPARRSSGALTMDEVLGQMNGQRGSRDPEIINVGLSFDSVTKRGNLLDNRTSNDYIFESVKAQTAIDEIIEREGRPVEGGGSFEFFYFNFDSAYVHPSNTLLNSVYVQVFPQGFVDQGGPGPFTNIPKVTLTKPRLEPGVHSNTLSLEAQLETEKGTNLIAIGDFKSGAYPTNYSKYRGAQEFFNSAANWETGKTYKYGTLVTNGGRTYECTVPHNSSGANEPPNTGFWILRAFNPFVYPFWTTSTSYVVNDPVKHNTIGYKALQSHTANSTNEPPNPDFWRRLSWMPTVEYSPLTRLRVQDWINAMGGANQSTTDNGKCAVIDPSVVIKDQVHPRTWTDVVGNDSTNLPNYLFPGGDPNNPFEGFRVLTMDPATGLTNIPATPGNKFIGNDINGRPFANNIVEWQIIDGTGQYVVLDLNDKFGNTALYPNPPGDNDLLNEQEVYDYDGGDSWVRGPLLHTTDVWFKGAYYSVSDNNLLFRDNAQFTCVHHPRFDTPNGRVDVTNTRILRVDTDVTEDSAVTIKFNPRAFETPLPLPLPVPILERFIGLNFAFPWPRTGQSLPYGAVTIGEKIANPFFDIFNMDKSQGGKRNWFGPEVEDYYPFQGFGFDSLIRDLIPLTDQPKFNRGDYAMAIWVMDNRDRIWILEYTQAHNDETEPKNASLSLKKVFRARFGFAGLVTPVEPEVTDIVDPRRIVRGGIYSKTSFNKFGQYDDRNMFATSGDNLQLSVDAFRLIKPLICTNNDEPNDLPIRNKEPQKLQMEKIESWPQLKNYVLSVAAIYNFRTDRYQIPTPGRINAAYGDPVYYTDPEAIDEKTDGINNTIKGVVSNTIYSLSKTPDGPGGFVRTVELTTRLWPEDPTP